MGMGDIDLAREEGTARPSGRTTLVGGEFTALVLAKFSEIDARLSNIEAQQRAIVKRLDLLENPPKRKKVDDGVDPL